MKTVHFGIFNNNNNIADKLFPSERRQSLRKTAYRNSDFIKWV